MDRPYRSQLSRKATLAREDPCTDQSNKTWNRGNTKGTGEERRMCKLRGDPVCVQGTRRKECGVGWCGGAGRNATPAKETRAIKKSSAAIHAPCSWKRPPGSRTGATHEHKRKRRATCHTWDCLGGSGGNKCHTHTQNPCPTTYTRRETHRNVVHD